MEPTTPNQKDTKAALYVAAEIEALGYTGSNESERRRLFTRATRLRREAIKSGNSREELRELLVWGKKREAYHQTLPPMDGSQTTLQHVRAAYDDMKSQGIGDTSVKMCCRRVDSKTAVAVYKGRVYMLTDKSGDLRLDPVGMQRPTVRATEMVGWV